jgi:GTPase SAR1 family protein
MYYSGTAFYRKLNQVYMSETVKTEFSDTIQNFIKYSNNFTKNNIPKSLRLILSGEDGIGKTTLIEAIATEFDCGIIHFMLNNYSERNIHSFFDYINKLRPNNIIIIDNINIDMIKTCNITIYNLLSELIIKNDKSNIFIFTFNQLNLIDQDFSVKYHIHHHYHMDTNINYIMNFIKDNLYQWSEYEIDSEKLGEVKNKIIRINHKITPGYIIPYLLFNEDFEKSLERFFRVIRN